MAEKAFDSPVSYYNYITTSQDREDELRELLNRITIKHTYFFRNEPQFKALKDKILPEIIDRKAAAAYSTGEKPTIRIWSAGCSTGEEPYTIAMIIKDMMIDPASINIQIIATDASQEAIANARKGVYGTNAMRLVDRAHRDAYFKELKKSGMDERYAISDEIKNMVSFGYHNLMEDEYPSGFDVILCRNVVIYFELETTVKVMSRFYSSLNDSEYLLIGYSETLYFMPEKFKMVNWHEAIYYRKLAKGVILPPGQEPVFTISKDKELQAALEEISRKELLADMEMDKTLEVAPSKGIKDILLESLKAIHLKDYAKAIGLLNEASLIDDKAPDPYYLAAEVYFNQGRFKEAREKLSHLLRQNPMFAPAYYLSGCIYMGENNLPAAKESIKKALYIDKDLWMAHFYLGQLYKAEDNINSAIREYRNTLKGLSGRVSDDIIAYSGGFNAATLMSVCRDNVERLKLQPTG